VAWHFKDLLMQAQRYNEALPVIEMIVERYPEDVLPAISRANMYHYYLDDLEEALRCIDMALVRAYKTGFFRRMALGDKARILLKLGNRGEQLSDVLEEIMSLEISKEIPDIGRERDFVDRAPPGLIRKDVLARYNKFRPRLTSDTRSGEPPEFGHADDAD